MHFHEMQNGAYIYNEIALHRRNKFSGVIITSTWGSDLLVYGNIESHKLKIQKALSWTQILTSEREDDYQVAAKMGYQGKFEAPIYITVGQGQINPALEETSARKSVVIKGYQDNHGRALNALQAVVDLRQKIDLTQFSFYVFSASESVKLQVELFSKELDIDFVLLPRMPKKQLMDYFDHARVYIGLSICDGLSTSMVEAMAHGVFPIQSRNSAAPDFLVHGLSGGIVDPWDIREISSLLKKALTDDAMVNNAAKMNHEALLRKYNWQEGITRIQSLYSLQAKSTSDI
jgi:glycosyltransferase involved in cell wall biosynthesis